MNVSRSARQLGLLSALAITGCGGGDDGPTGPGAPAAITLSPTSATLTYIGATSGFSATVRDANGQAVAATVSWTSSDPSVFTVDNSGTVTAVANGSGRLQASASGVTTTASVTVEQVPTVLRIVSGQDQEGDAGTKLPDPVVVQVADQGGTGVSGIVVSFVPGEGAGSADPPQAASDANGEASTEWTLGEDRFGAQSLGASIQQGASAVVNAVAVPQHPIPDLVIDSLRPSRDDPTELETFEIHLQVANLGDTTAPAFDVTLMVDGTEAETFEAAPIGAGARATLSYTVGPFEAGDRDIAMVLDPDDEIREWSEDNNVASVTTTVLRMELLEPGDSLTISSETAGEMLHFRIDIAEASQQALSVELAGGSGDPDMFVHFGERPVSFDDYECVAGWTTLPERCQIVPTRVGSYNVVVLAFSAFGPTTLTASVGEEVFDPFDIELVFLDNGTPSQDSIVVEAAKRWESVITLGTQDWDFSGGWIARPFAADRCFVGQPMVDDTVDDLRIWISIGEIDGPGGSVASAGPCHARGVSYGFGSAFVLQPILGSIVLDEDDVADLEEQEALLPVAVHEMAHVLGFGTSLWALKDLLHHPSLPDSADADTHFSGRLAIAAFDAVGGTGYSGGAKVPVQSGAVAGSSDTHWRERVFGDELMTPYMSVSDQRLSLVTIESLADLGYGVDLTKAESFTLSDAGLAGREVPKGRVIYLGDDISRNPVTVVDQKGRLIGVFHNRRE